MGLCGVRPAWVEFRGGRNEVGGIRKRRELKDGEIGVDRVRG